MRPLRLRIQDAVKREGIPQPIIEKDYALSYILAGVASHPALEDALVFKGGTALKKLFFGDYRFSEDLDYSAIDAPKDEQLEEAMREATRKTHRLLSEQGPFSIQLERYLERDPHPHGQEAFTIRVRFPWHPEPLCRIKVEITHDEPVLLRPERRRLMHGYKEPLPFDVCCYRLEEIVAEKLRTLLQTHRKIVMRGWNRPRARDYYDLWRILEAFGDRLQREQIMALLIKKCDHRGVTFKSLDDFFSDELVSETRLHWGANLGPFVSELPDCQNVLDRLQQLLRDLLPDLG